MPGFAMAWPGYALVIAAFCLAAGGVGDLVIRLESCSDLDPLRCAAANIAVGGLIWGALTGVLSELRAPAPVGYAALGAFGILGVVGSVNQFRRMARPGASALLLTGISAVLALPAGWVPVNPGALDPVNYAYITATLMRQDWVAHSLSSLPDAAQLMELTRLGMLTRAPAVALAWLATLAGWSIDARTIAGVGALLMLASTVLLADLLRPSASGSASVILAIAGVGVFNTMALLEGGQINQAFALCVATAIVWAWRWMPVGWQRYVVLGLGSLVIAAGYPEFLLVLPLYGLALLVVRPGSTPREITFAAASMIAGICVAVLCAPQSFGDYLMQQSRIGPHWWPLAADPRWIGDEWIAILAQRSPPRIGLFLPVAGLIFGWWLAPRVGRDAVQMWLVRLVLLSLVPLLIVWSWTLGQSANPNYATFKVAGWVGPGLLILAWQLLPSIRRTLVSRLLTSLFFGLAAFRIAALAVEIYQVWPEDASSTVSSGEWEVLQTDGGCLLRLETIDYQHVLKAVAASAAPARGCAVREPQ